MIGLTSVTFRNLNYKEIIQLCADNGIKAIEWGGDIHVPVGEFELAAEVGALTRRNGISTYSYGSYYRLGESRQPENDFEAVVKTAASLGCSLVRIWAGSTDGDCNLEETISDNMEELRRICPIAAGYQIKIGLEYHRNTLTETKEVTRRLLDETGADNLYTYWQMNPDISHEERLEEIELLKDKICNIHAFYLEKSGEKPAKDVRCSLKKGMPYWSEYWKLIKPLGCNLIIEFVKDDRIQQLAEDVESLRILQNSDIAQRSNTMGSGSL